MPRHITRKPTRQEPHRPRDLIRHARPLQPNLSLLYLLGLQTRRRQLLLILSPLIHDLQIHPDIDLSGTHTIDPHAAPFQTRYAGSHNAQRRVVRHGEGGTPAASGGARDAGDDDDAAVGLVFGCRVGVVAFWGGFLHGGWGVFEGEEGHEGVGFEEFVDVGWGGVGEGWGAEEAGGGDEDV